MEKKLAKELAKKAKGNIKTKHLTDDGNILQTYLYSGPLIQYLNTSEQPEYILNSEQYGFEITKEDGSTSKPHHSNADGKTYLLITNQRILYIAGLREGDEVTEFDYEDLEDVRIESGHIEFSTIEGRTYKYIHQIGDDKTVESAVNYISKKLIFEPSHAGTDEKFRFTAHINSYDLQLTDRSEYSPTDLSEQFSSTDSYEITADESGVQIYDNKYRVEFDEIAEIQEFEDGVIVSNSGSVYETKNVGIKLITGDGGELRIYEQYLGSSPAPEINFSTEITQFFSEHIDDSSNAELPYEYSLSDYLTIDKPKMKIEGWTDGSSDISADIDADAASEGKSKGIEIGPFTRSKNSSTSSIDGDISGAISDNTYTTKVNTFKIYDGYLYIDSELELDLYYSDIDNIFKHNDGGMTKEGETLVEKGDGVVIETGSMTLRINDLPKGSPVDQGINFVKSELNNSGGQNNTDDKNKGANTDKIREIKELYDDGVISEEEFESKKQELLDNL